MVIGEHFGPNGQVFYEEHSPEGDDGPARFHTLVAGLSPYHSRRERRGRTVVVIYATDYSRVEYEPTDREGRTYTSSHTAAGSFAPATELQYVAGSDVLGGMGAGLLPFGEPTDAEAFAGDCGGRAVESEETDREFIREYR